MNSRLADPAIPWPCTPMEATLALCSAGIRITGSMTSCRRPGRGIPLILTASTTEPKRPMGKDERRGETVVRQGTDVRLTPTDLELAKVVKP